MCGIFGVGFLNGHNATDKDMMRKIVRELFLATEERGKTASGIAYTSMKEVHVAKDALTASKFVTTKQYEKTEKLLDGLRSLHQYGTGSLLSIVGHCRQKTKGTERNNANNHPIVRDLIVGVHNGMIHNDDITFNNYKDAIKRNGEVDSEIIFALIEYFSQEVIKSVKEAVDTTAMMLTGSASCAFVDKRHPGLVWLFKRVTPCEVVMFDKIGVVMWASRKEYIYKATADYFKEFGAGKEIEYPNKSGICMDLYRNKIFKFDLTDTSKEVK